MKSRRNKPKCIPTKQGSKSASNKETRTQRENQAIERCNKIQGYESRFYLRQRHIKLGKGKPESKRQKQARKENEVQAKERDN